MDMGGVFGTLLTFYARNPRVFGTMPCGDAAAATLAAPATAQSDWRRSFPDQSFQRTPLAGTRSLSDRTIGLGSLCSFDRGQENRRNIAERLAVIIEQNFCTARV
jgi:hypothetical protein